MSEVIEFTLLTGEIIVFDTNQLIKVSNQGSLFNGVNKTTGQAVIIKLSKVFLMGEIVSSDDPADKWHSYHEAQILQQLQVVAGVPQYLGLQRLQISATTERYALVMTAISGTDFEQLHRAKPNALLPYQTTAVVLRELATILQTVHERNIIHCDLKFSNLMQTSSQHYAIVDWGTAQHIRSGQVLSHKPQTIIGTVQYMSYEQVTAQPLDQRTDIYSLGAVLLVLTYGYRLSQRYTIAADRSVHERSKTEIAKALAHKETLKYELLPKPHDSLEQRLQAMLWKMTQVDRSKRYQTMAELLDTSLKLL